MIATLKVMSLFQVENLWDRSWEKEGWKFKNIRIFEKINSRYYAIAIFNRRWQGETGFKWILKWEMEESKLIRIPARFVQNFQCTKCTPGKRSEGEQIEERERANIRGNEIIEWLKCFGTFFTKERDSEISSIITKVYYILLGTDERLWTLG